MADDNNVKCVTQALDIKDKRLISCSVSFLSSIHINYVLLGRNSE